MLRVRQRDPSSAEECQTAAVCSATIKRIVSALDVFDVASPVNDCDVQLLVAMHVPMKTLLIDNYDSYTYNLFQLIADVNGVAPDVVFNDELTWLELLKRIECRQYHNIVISPGPGTPHCAADIGVCKQLFKEDLQVPVLGVCLGMQALAVSHGASVQHAPEPIHGRLSHIEHTGHQLFQHIPSGVDSTFAVVRYHSLAVNETTLPASLKVIAWTCGGHTSLRAPPAAVQDDTNSSQSQKTQPASAADRVVQAVAHSSLPLYGVQFHPESIGTAFGRQLLQNFAAITAELHGLPAGPGLERSPVAVPSQQHATSQATLEVEVRKVEGLLKAVGGAEGIFMHLFGSQGAQDTFWLDSSASDRGRFSYMGGHGGPLWQRITYQLSPPSSTQAPRSSRLQPPATSSAHHNISTTVKQPSSGTLTVEHASGQVMTHQMSLWDYLKQQLESCRVQSNERTAVQLPFDFCGGLVGYLGYELKAELGGQNAHQAQTPDAAMFLADRLIAIDHLHSHIYLIALAKRQSLESHASAQDWLQTIQDKLQAMLPSKSPRSDSIPDLQHQPAGELAHSSMHDRSTQTPPHTDAVSSTLPVGDCEQAELASDGMSQLSCQTQQHMDTASHSALSDEEMLDDEQAYLSASRSYRGRPAHPSNATAASGNIQQPTDRCTDSQQATDTCSDMCTETCIDGQQAQDRCTDSQQAQDRCTDTQEAQDRCTDSHQASDTCTKSQHSAGTRTCQASDRQTDAAEMQVSPPPPFKLARSRQQYLRDVEACQQALYDGDSYEICLTTALVRDHPLDPLQLYRTLRRVNPAPYAAWLSFRGADDIQICCASPERFLKGGRGGTLEAKPIKGTAPRFPDAAQDRASALALASSEKDQAENLMIVDLLRNDLGRVCQVGSVHVPALMEVESFATVHQLVSTVRGQRRPEKSIIDCIQAAFPGGSMTGAPKVRSMQILDAIEKQARGVYSGSLGFIGFNDTFDLNIVIRTAVIQGGRTRIGAGGAIVVQSDAVGEYDEMRLKASALLKAVALSSGEPVCPPEVDVGEA